MPTHTRTLHAIPTAALLVMFIFTWCGPAPAAGPWVKIVISPLQTEYESDTMVYLTTDSGGTDLEFTWRLVGPGSLQGTGASVVYNPPATLDASSVPIEVTLVVRDKLGREAADAVKFAIIPAVPDAPALSTGTKIALGAGGVALVGGGVALAFLTGDDDSDDGSLPVFGNWEFSGDVLKDTCDFLMPGLPTTAREALNIEQSGSGLTASHQLGNVLQGEWRFTGKLTDNNFQLTSVNPFTGTSGFDCTYSMTAEVNVENIVDNSGIGGLLINVTGVSGCSGSCQGVWPGTWTRVGW